MLNRHILKRALKTKENIPRVHVERGIERQGEKWMAMGEGRAKTIYTKLKKLSRKIT